MAAWHSKWPCVVARFGLADGLLCSAHNSQAVAGDWNLSRQTTQLIFTVETKRIVQNLLPLNPVLSSLHKTVTKEIPTFPMIYVVEIEIMYTVLSCCCLAPCLLLDYGYSVSVRLFRDAVTH
jgi:hypothetical protein